MIHREQVRALLRAGPMTLEEIKDSLAGDSRVFRREAADVVREMTCAGLLSLDDAGRYLVAREPSGANRHRGANLLQRAREALGEEWTTAAAVAEELRTPTPYARILLWRLRDMGIAESSPSPSAKGVLEWRLRP